ncbi:hypothetical protein BDF21DRAFT_466954 [Thamnidium elegans]|nr:hypothetical protein BDF21DRAFT_466954 [Thamnidium elegans]
MICKVVPRWGKTSPIVYLSICSLVGSLSVMAIKAFAVSEKKSSWDDESTTDTENSLQHNAIRNRPRALSV